MADIANLLVKHGYKYKAKINGDPVSGEICVEGSVAYLLHTNKSHAGSTPAPFTIESGPW